MIGRRARLLMAFGGLTGLMLLSPGHESAGPVRPSYPSPSTRSIQALKERSVDASEALERARRIKRQMSGAPASERPMRRQRAIAAYEKVYEYASDTDAHGIEAAFRVGELARAGGEPVRAWAAFERAATAIPCSLAFRARVELGHLARRRGEVELAMRQYQKLLMGPCEDPYIRDVAMYWFSRVQCEAGRARASGDTLEQLRTRLDHGPLLKRVERDLERLSKDANAVGSDVWPAESSARADFF